MNKRCFKVVLERAGVYFGDRQEFTVVASCAIVAINKAIMAARREHGRSRWDAVSLEKIGNVS